MQAFTTHTGLVLPLDRANIDTDAIIPKQFLKSIHRSGYGYYLFDEWRYLDHGEPGMDCSNRPLNKDFVLNQPRYQGASILIARANFGCGSSREHAPWALLDYGIRCIIAPSFADIFYNNCCKNGILPIVLHTTVVDHLFTSCFADCSQEGYRLTINLATQTVNQKMTFTIDAFRKSCLLGGLDDIDLTLQQAAAIRSYEKKHRQQAPWLFD